LMILGVPSNPSCFVILWFYEVLCHLGGECCLSLNRGTCPCLLFLSGSLEAGSGSVRLVLKMLRRKKKTNSKPNRFPFLVVIIPAALTCSLLTLPIGLDPEHSSCCWPHESTQHQVLSGMHGCMPMNEFGCRQKLCSAQLLRAPKGPREG